MFILKIILKWIVLAAAAVLATHFIPAIGISAWNTALIFGLIFGLINIFIKPILSILSIPINILTLGLFGLVVNALLFLGATYLVTAQIIPFMPALFGSIIVSVVMWLAHFFLD
jgi:putative membrane protein